MLRWGVVVAVVCALLSGAGALALRRSIDPVTPWRSGFDEATIVRGAQLAALGNCTGCHTPSDGAPFAGGVPLKTPFGTIYGSNITPDVETGIGDWSEAAFVRAMRKGVSRDGHLLYPAFPYTHFTHTTDRDLHALYAFVMTRDPVHAVPPANDLTFPLRFRPLIAGWNLLYFHEATDAQNRRLEAQDRGRYLIESLGHCGGCHSPRNALGAEEPGRPLAGNVIEGWYAPPLDARSPSPLPWTDEAMTAYLRDGLANDHAIAAGPMQDVVGGLSRASGDDVRAVATAIVANMGAVDASRRASAVASRARAATPLSSQPVDPAFEVGASIYADACARCHDRGRGVSSNSALQMPLAVALYDADPHSFVQIVRQGVQPPAGEEGRFMPAYGATLTDAQLVALAGYLRHAAADLPAWSGLDAAVAATRE